MWEDLVWNINPRWTFAIGAGFDNPNDKGNLKGQIGPQALNDKQFTKNTQYFANLWYKLTENFDLGVEVVHIETERKKNGSTPLIGSPSQLFTISNSA